MVQSGRAEAGEQPYVRVVPRREQRPDGRADPGPCRLVQPGRVLRAERGQDDDLVPGDGVAGAGLQVQ